MVPDRPDALFISASRKRGPRLADRVASIAEIAEPLLGADRAAGGRAYVRQQGNDWLFITLSPHDTINFPTDHPRSGQPRYVWVNQPDGSRFGYLVEAPWFVGPERIIWNGEPGTHWENDTDRVQYQFIASLANTCGVCLQYHMAIGPRWPIPIHHRCRCHQEAIAPGGQANHAFVDFREILADLPHDQQVAAIGASNYKLLEAGKITWEDVVTPTRVRDLREVVANKKLTVKAMTDVGVRPHVAEQAHQSVHTAAHELADQQRRDLAARILARGVGQKELVESLARGIANRATVAAGPTGKYTEGPAWAAHGLPGLGETGARDLAKHLLGWRRPPPGGGPAGTPAPLPPKPPAPFYPDQFELPVRGRLVNTPPEPIGDYLPTDAELEKPFKVKKPKAPPKPKPPPFPKIGDKLNVEAQLGGSTGAQLVVDPATGRKYVMKKGGNAGHLREEAAADDLYRAAGLEVTRSKVYDRPGGPVKLSEFVSGKTLGSLEHSDPAAYQRAVKELRKGFVADALLGNWDVVGAAPDNIQVTDAGKVLRLDNGGSLRYRAQGSLKSTSQWTGTVGELSSLRNPSMNPAAAKIFGGITEEEIKAQTRAILRREKAILKAAPEELRDTLKQRLDYLRENAKTAKAVRVGNWKATPADRFQENSPNLDRCGEEHFRQWREALSTAERSAISVYTGSGYRELNKYLRGDRAAPADAARVVPNLALNSKPVPHDLVVYRGTDLTQVYHKMGISARTDLRPGMDLIDKGYTSTSPDYNRAWGGEKLEIRVKKGMPGGWVAPVSSHETEREFLLGRDVDTFRIVEIKPDKIVVEALRSEDLAKTKRRRTK